MNATLQKRLDGVEAALGTLTNSITSYHPSTAAARALLEADSDLGASVDELSTHQQNHQRLASLHATAAKLEARMRTTLTELATLRTAVLASGPSSAGSGADAGAVPIPALLAAAQNAARYRAPRGYVAPSKREDAVAAQPKSDPASAALSPTALPATDAEPKDGKNPALDVLDPGMLGWLDPVTQVAYAPWPSEDMIARSGLARAQNWVGAVENVPVQAKEEEEEEAKEQEDGGVAGEQHAARDAAARAAADVRAREREEKPKVFMGMELLGDDDD